jgi:hypothetical protein
MTRRHWLKSLAAPLLAACVGCGKNDDEGPIGPPPPDRFPPRPTKDRKDKSSKPPPTEPQPPR